MVYILIGVEFLFLLFVIWLAVFIGKIIFNGWDSDIGLVEEYFRKTAFTIYTTFFTIVIVFVICLFFMEVATLF